MSRFSLALIVAVAVCAGCGGGRVPVYPASGSVMWQGRPAAGARVVFVSDQQRDMTGRDAAIPAATTDAQGRFHLTSYEEGDGAPAGQYKVAVTWYEVVRGHDDPEQVVERDRLEGKYADAETSGLTATIAAGDNALPPFELD
jgi:hypothetical protein